MLVSYLIIFLLLGISYSSSFPVGEIVKDPIAVMNHDENCFTQGLVIYDNKLYESCGLYGKSTLRIVDLSTGSVVKKVTIDKDIFAEGLAAMNNTLYMISWKNKKLFIYDRKTLDLLDTKYFDSHNGEGWGLTTDNEHLILSDGSEYIIYYEFPSPGDGKEKLVKIREMKVYDPVTMRHLVYINELEYHNGYIFANIWYKDIILQINANSGNVVERYDLSQLYPKSSRSHKADCLNGIAYDPIQKNFLLTGKLWPKYYRVHFKAAEDDHHKSPTDL